MKKKRRAIHFPVSTVALGMLFLAAMATFSGCHKEKDHDPLAKKIAALRKATAAFHDIDIAHKAGYVIPIPDNPSECLADPVLGAMGFHFGNGDLIPNKTLDIKEPEVLIYEPQPDGHLQLVGVEYVVPFSLWGKDKKPPVLFGQAFLQNDRFQVWALHVWVWRSNPSGLFSPYNPEVSCDPRL